MQEKSSACQSPSQSASRGGLREAPWSAAASRRFGIRPTRKAASSRRTPRRFAQDPAAACRGQRVSLPAKTFLLFALANWSLRPIWLRPEASPGCILFTQAQGRGEAEKKKEPNNHRWPAALGRLPFGLVCQTERRRAKN